MPPEPRPKGGGEGRVFYSLLRSPGGFMGHAADHRAADPQIGKLATVQVIKLAHGLAKQRPACEVIAQIGHKVPETPSDSIAFVGNSPVQFDNSHIIHSHFALSFGTAVALLGRTCYFRRGLTRDRTAMLLCRNRIALEKRHRNAFINLNFFLRLCSVSRKSR